MTNSDNEYDDARETEEEELETQDNASNPPTDTTPNPATMIAELKARKVTLENEILALQYELEFVRNPNARARAAKAKKIRKETKTIRSVG
jgi:hypothetical protein